MLTLTNSFHNTRTTIRMTTAELDALVYAAEVAHGSMPATEEYRQKCAAKLRRIARRLCPSKASGCTCSGATGER